MIKIAVTSEGESELTWPDWLRTFGGRSVHMDLRGYISALSRNWLLIVVLMVVGGGLGFGGYKITPPTFASTVTFYVSTPLNNATNPQAGGQFAESRVDSYALLLQSDRLADRVAQDVGLPASDVEGTITASAQPSTVLVTATIANGSQQRTGQLARSVATAFPAMVDELDNQDSTQSTVEINVVSGPTPTEQIAPSAKKYLALGLAAGLVLGAVIALLRELLDVTVRSVETASALIGAPVIGMIDHDNSTKKSPLIIGQRATSARAEGFRQLRTNLNYIGSVDPADVLVVTSSVPLEGKSTVAADLALTQVEAGSRVLLIDADLRRPKVSEIFGLEQAVGLTNVLVGRISVAEAIQSWGSDGPDVLTSGGLPPNPSEMLGGSAMNQLIRDLRRSYDKIIIDAPPVLPVADAIVAAELADGVLFVIRHGKTHRNSVTMAARALHAVNARIVGTVLNMRRLSRPERKQYVSTGYTSDLGATTPLAHDRVTASEESSASVSDLSSHPHHASSKSDPAGGRSYREGLEVG